MSKRTRLPSATRHLQPKLKRGRSIPHSATDIVDLGSPRDGIALRLAPITRDDAATLGQALSEIDPWVSYPYPASALVSFLAAQEADACRYTIKQNDAIAGVLVLRLNWLRGPYIHLLAVLPGFQSSGIGRCVLQWCEDVALSRSDRNLWIAVSDFNDRAIQLYERFGFARTADLDGLVKDGQTEILMRKKLF